MKKLYIPLLFLFSNIILFGQDTVSQNIVNKLRLHEKLFIEKINQERVKRNLGVISFNKGIYDTVSTPQAIHMSEVLSVSHTPNGINDHCGECAGGVFYNGGLTLSDDCVTQFKNSKKGHWDDLMLKHIKIMSIRMEYTIWDGTETVYVCVNFK